MDRKIEISKIRPECTVQVPGSKSFTHRFLVASSLAEGHCVLQNPLVSEDTRLTAAGLQRMGVSIDWQGDEIKVGGSAGRLAACSGPIDLSNSGTSMRLLTAVAALGTGDYTLSGSQRMQQRPIGDLIDGLLQMGISVASLNGNGCPPVRVSGGKVNGGHVELDCGKSSQYLSALLLIGPYADNGLEVTVSQGPVSRPYIDMTVSVMEQFGIHLDRTGYQQFRILPQQRYRPGTYRIEPDASNAGYFWAAAAITGTTVSVSGIGTDSVQGDLRFVDILEKMGCRVERQLKAITVSGGRLKAVEVDMADMPDLVPTLAVIAAFSNGTTRIRNVAHLRIKESDRLAAVTRELTRMGVNAFCDTDSLTVTGGDIKPAKIHTYDDHRMAMSFAVAALRAPGTVIEDEACVQKSFPEFWRVFETIEDK